jgi:ubiquinone/menaquinone biosynthesis C-methylase UbiE
MSKPSRSDREVRSRRQVEAEFDAVACYYDALPLAAHGSARRILDYVPRDTKRALDIGCGTGRLLSELGTRVEVVHGVDLSYRMLRLARKRCTERGQDFVVARMDITQLAFPACSLDFVVVHTVLHHLNEVDKGLREIRRVLRPGGRAVIVDILRRRVTGRWPVLASYLLAAIHAAMVLLEGGWRRARHAWRSATGTSWIDHQRGECFFERLRFVELCYRELEGSRVTEEAGEFGLTDYVTVVWDKKPQ